MAQVPNALIVNPNNIKAANLSELIEYLQKNPDKVTSATQGNGTTSHLTSELFQLMAKVKLRHIPYRGSAPALQGLLAGDVDLMFDNLGVSLPLVNSGKLKLLAVASAHRLPALPDVPTIAEMLPGFEAVAWYGIVAPPKTPQEHRRQDQCGCERSSAAARVAGTPRQAVCRDLRRLDRENLEIHARGSGPMGCRDQGGEISSSSDEVIPADQRKAFRKRMTFPRTVGQRHAQALVCDNNTIRPRIEQSSYLLAGPRFPPRPA